MPNKSVRMWSPWERHLPYAELLMTLHGYGERGVTSWTLMREMEGVYGRPVPNKVLLAQLSILRRHGAAQSAWPPGGKRMGNNLPLKRWSLTAEGERQLRALLGRIARINNRAQQRRERLESRERENGYGNR